MKKFFILALLALAFTSCDQIAQLEDAKNEVITEEVAKLLEVPAESVDLDFDNVEMYDSHFFDKLIGRVDSGKFTYLYTDKNSGKKFIVVWESVNITSIEFAPEEE